MALLNDVECVRYIITCKEEWEITWMLFENVLRDSTSTFEDKYIDKHLFLIIYKQVCTRCFGEGLDSASMIPMADNCNHNSFFITNEFINLSMHTNKQNDASYYRYAKYMADYSAAFRANGWSQEKIKRNSLNITGRFSREVYNMNTKVLSTDHFKNNLESSNKQIWEVPFFYEPFDEDNDSSDEERIEKENESTTEEDESDEEEPKPSEFKGRLDHGLKPFIAEEKDQLKE